MPPGSSSAIGVAYTMYLRASQVVLVVKNPPASAGVCLIPGLGRPPGEENATHSSILAWRIPWTEEPGRLQSIRSQRVGPNEVS